MTGWAEEIEKKCVQNCSIIKMEEEGYVTYRK